MATTLTPVQAFGSPFYSLTGAQAVSGFSNLLLLGHSSSELRPPFFSGRITREVHIAITVVSRRYIQLPFCSLADIRQTYHHRRWLSLAHYGQLRRKMQMNAFDWWKCSYCCIINVTCPRPSRTRHWIVVILQTLFKQPIRLQKNINCTLFIPSRHVLGWYLRTLQCSRRRIERPELIRKVHSQILHTKLEVLVPDSVLIGYKQKINWTICLLFAMEFLLSPERCATSMLYYFPFGRFSDLHRSIRPNFPTPRPADICFGKALSEKAPTTDDESFFQFYLKRYLFWILTI